MLRHRSRAIRFLKLGSVGAFIAAVPLLLITINVRWVVNSPVLYSYGFDKYDIPYWTGIERDELLSAGRQIRDYFNNDAEHLEFTLDLGTGDVTAAAALYETGTLQVTIDNSASPSLITIGPIPIPTQEVTAQLAHHVLPKSNNRSICLIESGNWNCDESSDGDVAGSVPNESTFSVQFASPAAAGQVSEADFAIDDTGNVTFTAFKGPGGGYDGGTGQLTPDIDNGSDPAVITFNLESTDVELAFSGFGPIEDSLWEPAHLWLLYTFPSPRDLSTSRIPSSP